MRRSERAGVALVASSRVAQSCGVWKSLSSILVILITFLTIHPADSSPINRQVGISENVFITVQNDTYGNEQRVCSIDSVTYTDGESIPTASPCEHCICRPPGFACTIISCEYRPGCKALKRSNQCCPEYQCECEKDGKIYQNGEKILDNNNPCEVCYCQGGDVICAVIDCYWRSDCQPRYIENRCCPLYDHCPPPNQPGPMRPTQRPLTTTTTTGTTVGWFNLSSSIFASSSTPFTQLEDLSSTTPSAFFSTPAAIPVFVSSSSSPPTIPEVETIPESVIPSQVPVVQEKSTETPTVPTTLYTPVESSSSVSPINVISVSSSESPISTPTEESVEPVKDVLLNEASSSPASTPIEIIVTSEVPVTSSVNPIQSLVQDSTPVTAPVEIVAPIESQTQSESHVVPSSSSPPSLTVDPSPPEPVSPLEDVPASQVVEEVSPSVSPSPVESSSSVPHTTVISNVVPIIIVATPVQESVQPSAEQTTVPDLSPVVDVEQLPVSIQSSSSSVEPTVLVTLSSSSDKEETTVSVIHPVEPTEVLQTITVLNTNTLDASSSLVLDDPAQPQVINPTATLVPADVSVVVDPSATLPSSNLIVDAADSPADHTVQEEQSVGTGQVQSQVTEESSVTPPVSSPVEPISSEATDVQSDQEVVTTTQVIPVEKPVNDLVAPPSLVLEPPSKPFGESHHQNEILEDSKPVEVAPPAIVLTPPTEDKIAPVVPVVEEKPVIVVPLPAETTVKSVPEIVEVQTNAPISSDIVQPSADAAIVTEVEQTTFAIVSDDVPSSSLVPPVVSSEPNIVVPSTSLVPPKISPSEPPTIVQVSTEEEKTTDFPALNDAPAIVTEIPTQRPVQADSPSVSSSAEVVDQGKPTEPNIVQDVPIQSIENFDNPTNPPPASASVVQEISEDSHDPPVVEVTDSAPVFIETSDTQKAQDVPSSSSSEVVNNPTLAPAGIVSDDVTEVAVDLTHSSTVPSSESLVSVSFSDVNDPNAVTATGDQLDSQDQSDPTSDNNNSQDAIVPTTTQKFVLSVSDPVVQNDPNVMEVVDSSAEQTLPETLTTTVPSSSVSPDKIQSSSSSVPPPPMKIEDIEIMDKVNDEPETTVSSVQDGPVVADDVPEIVEATTVVISPPKENVGSEVLSDEPAVSKGDAVTPKVESNVNPPQQQQAQQQKPASSITNEEPVPTTLNPVNVVSDVGGVQFDESSSQNEETTVRPSISSSSSASVSSVEESVLNDEPQGVTTVLSTIVKDEPEESGTVNPVVKEISDSSSESKFRLDPSVFNEIESASSNSREQEVPVQSVNIKVDALSSSNSPSLSPVHISDSAASVHSSQSSVDKLIATKNDSPKSSLNNLPTHHPTEEEKSESNNINRIVPVVVNEAEQQQEQLDGVGVTTEINRKTQDLQDGGVEGIELTTAGSKIINLGEERKEENEESTSVKSTHQQQEEIKDDSVANTVSDSVVENEGGDKPTENPQDEKVEGDETVVATTLTNLLLRHHHPDHEGTGVDKTTKVPSSSSQKPSQSDDVQDILATTIFPDVQDEPLSATTNIKHDFRSGLDSAEVNNVNVDSLSQKKHGESTNKIVSKVEEPQQSNDVVTTVASDIADLPESTNPPPPSSSAQPDKAGHDDKDEEEDVAETTEILPIEDIIQDQPQTTFLPITREEDRMVNETVVEQQNSKVNSTVERVILIPNELVKRLDPITDDLSQNGLLGRSDLSLQSQMKDEVSSADETWLWRAVNRIRTLPDFLPTILTRQPRSVPASTKPELFKPNKTKKATQAQPPRKKYVAHRPFLFW